MVRKVIAGQELLKASGTVTGKLVRWLAERGYIDEESATDVSGRAREAARDLPIADRLGMLLHEVTDRAPAIDPDSVGDEDWVEDYLEISDVEPGRIWFEGGVGPIAVPREVSDLARPGWSPFVTATRFGGAGICSRSASSVREERSGRIATHSTESRACAAIDASRPAVAPASRRSGQTGANSSVGKRRPASPMGRREGSPSASYAAERTHSALVESSEARGDDPIDQRTGGPAWP